MDNNSNKNSSSAAGGVGFFGLLALVFIVLKLTGVIGWSWMWVLAPIWIPAVIVIGIMLIVLVVIVVTEVLKQRKSAELDAEAERHGIRRRYGESDTSLKRRLAIFGNTENRGRHE